MSVVDFVVGQQRDTAARLRAAERQHDELQREGLDDAAVMNAEERLAAVKQRHEAVRRDKKALFANFFAGVCTLLGEADGASAGGIAPTDPEWRRVCVGHAHAIGARLAVERGT